MSRLSLSALRNLSALLVFGTALICAPPVAAEDAASAMQHHLDAARKARTTNEWDTANAQFDLALKQAASLDAGDSRVVRALEEAARAYAHQKDGARAIALQEQAVAGQRAASQTPDNALAEALYNLGRLYREFGAGDRAETVLREALEIHERFDPQTLRATMMRRDLSKTIQELRADDDEAETLLKRDLEQGDTASRREQLGRYYAQTERHESSAAHFEEAIAIERALPLPSGRRLAHLLASLAIEYRHLGRFGESEAAFRETIELSENDLGPEHPQLAFTLRRLAGLYIEQERWLDAEAALLRARDLNAEAWGEKYHECSCSTGDLLAQVQQALGKTEAPARSAAQGRGIPFGFDTAAEEPEIPEPAQPAESAELSEIDKRIRGHEDEARRQRKLGHIELAKDSAQLALTLREQTYGPDSLSAADGIERLARLWQDQRRFDEAATLFERRLALLQAQLDADDPRIGATLNILGQLSRDRNHYVDAERYLLAEINLRETIGQRIEAARTLETLGNLNLTRQLPERAAANFSRVIELWQDFAGGQAPEVVRNRARLAQALLKLDRLDEAETMLTELLDVEQAKRYPDTGLLIQILQPLKTVLERTDRPTEAQAVEARMQELRALRTAALDGPRPAAEPTATRRTVVDRKAS